MRFVVSATVGISAETENSPLNNLKTVWLQPSILRSVPPLRGETQRRNYKKRKNKTGNITLLKINYVRRRRGSGGSERDPARGRGRQLLLGFERSQNTKVADHLRGPSAFDSRPISALITADVMSKNYSHNF